MVVSFFKKILKPKKITSKPTGKKREKNSLQQQQVIGGLPWVVAKEIKRFNSIRSESRLALNQRPKALIQAFKVPVTKDAGVVSREKIITKFKNILVPEFISSADLVVSNDKNKLTFEDDNLIIILNYKSEEEIKDFKPYCQVKVELKKGKKKFKEYQKPMLLALIKKLEKELNFQVTNYTFTDKYLMEKLNIKDYNPLVLLKDFQEEDYKGKKLTEDLSVQLLTTALVAIESEKDIELNLNKVISELNERLTNPGLKEEEVNELEIMKNTMVAYLKVVKDKNIEYKKMFDKLLMIHKTALAAQKLTDVSQEILDKAREDINNLGKNKDDLEKRKAQLNTPVDKQLRTGVDYSSYSEDKYEDGYDDFEGFGEDFDEDYKGGDDESEDGFYDLEGFDEDEYDDDSAEG